MSNHNYTLNGINELKVDAHQVDDIGSGATASSPNAGVHSDVDTSIHTTLISEKCNHLTGREIWNLSFCFLAFACNVSTVTLGKW
jgi:hypothetical protein